MRFVAVFCALVVLLRPEAARAAWMEASSAHFVIYADDSESDLRLFCEQLERFHSAMEVVTKFKSKPPSPSNRVTVFVVRNEAMVRQLYGDGSANIGGFYLPRAGRSLAIVPRVNSKNGVADYSMVVLLHEYAHHFMIGGSNFPMPRWLSEGGAEFFSSSGFGSDGGVSLGRPARHRADELFYARDVKAEELLDPDLYDERRTKMYDAFYGKSWLLYHYLTFDEARKGQLTLYISLLKGGTLQRDAAIQAFGDFAKLERDLDAYLRKSRINAFSLPSSMLKTGNIAIRRLRDGEAAIMPVRIRSSRGVNEEQAKALLVDARRIAASYPGDADVQSALAEAEFDAGNDNEAIAAADAALAIDPGQVNAYVQKGFALFRIAEGTETKPAAYKAARAPFIALNQREHDHPIPLIYYYRSFAEQGVAPPPLAIDGLITAVEVAPFDLDLRMTLATALIQLARQDEAQIILEPVAYNPHADQLSSAAMRLLEKLKAEPEWRGANMSEVISAPSTESLSK